MTTTERARVTRLTAYAQIINNARAALLAIRDCGDVDPVRYVLTVDRIACDALTMLEIDLEGATR